MGIYVMVVTDDTKEAYFFVGPFNTDIDACVWGEQQDDANPDWHVLELDDPGAEPRILPPTIRPIASGRVEDIITPSAGERGRYILCWTMSSYHFIGPFGDADQCMQFVNYDDCNNDGPYRDPRWYVLLLDEPPRSPQVVPSTMQPLSAEEVRRRAEIAERRTRSWRIC